MSFSNVMATLYYMKADNQNLGGYVIIDINNEIIELSLGEPRYDNSDSKAINRSGDKIALQMNKENLVDDVHHEQR
jgi:hypothetical protein